MSRPVTPEQKAAAAERKRAWAERNADHVKAKRAEKYRRTREASIAYSVEWNRTNRERRAEISATYEAANPDVRRAVKARRRARSRLAGEVSASDIRALLKLQGWRCAACACCLRSNPRELDHFIPLALGGTNDRLNLQMLCRTCNRRKGAKDPLAFWRELHGGSMP